MGLPNFSAQSRFSGSVFVMIYRLSASRPIGWAPIVPIQFFHPGSCIKTNVLTRWYESLAFAVVILAFASPSGARSSSEERNSDSYNASQIVKAQLLESPYLYYFPVLEAGAESDSGQFPMPLCHGFNLEGATIYQLQEAMEDGKLSSKKLVGCCLQRIYQTDFYIT